MPPECRRLRAWSRHLATTLLRALLCRRGYKAAGANGHFLLAQRTTALPQLIEDFDAEGAETSSLYIYTMLAYAGHAAV